MLFKKVRVIVRVLGSLHWKKQTKNKYILKLLGIIFLIKLWLFWCYTRANLAPCQVNLTGTQKSLFSWNFNHSWIRQKVFFLLPDTFSSNFNFLRQRKWVYVIPFLMGEQANLLTFSIVDWLSDGREAGDKRKVQKERFIWLPTLHSSLLSFSWETDYGLLDYPDVSYSPSLHIQSISPPLHISSCQGRHWSPVP